MNTPLEYIQAMKIINEGRASIGKPPFDWSNQLHLSAQELAEWGWKHYLANDLDVTEHAHFEFTERLVRAGVIVENQSWSGIASECGIDGTSDTLGEDGVRYPPDPSGWSHPFKSVETHAKGYVYDLTKSNIAKDLNEGHVRDFRGAWTHIGLGYRGGCFVVDYGLR